MGYMGAETSKSTFEEVNNNNFDITHNSNIEHCINDELIENKKNINNEKIESIKIIQSCIKGHNTRKNFNNNKQEYIDNKETHIDNKETHIDNKETHIDNNKQIDNQDLYEIVKKKDY